MSSFTPTSISGLSVWLDAADSSTFALSGSNVSSWRDKVGSKYFVPSNSSYPPAKVGNSVQFSNPSTSAIGGTNRGLQYNTAGWTLPTQNVTMMLVTTSSSNDSYLRCAVALTSNSPYTSRPNMFMVAQVQSPTEGMSICLDLNGSWGGQTNAALSAYSLAIRQDCLLSAPTSQIFSNGTEVSYATRTSSYTSPYSNYPSVIMCLAASANPDIMGSRIYNGYIHEVLVFTKALSTTERQDVEGYLAWKWSTQGSLPTNHPYKNSASLAPNAPTNVAATKGSKKVVLTWTASTSTGITRYDVMYNSGVVATVSGSATTATVTGLTNGTTYTYTVRAYTTMYSVDSSSASATPSNTVATGTITFTGFTTVPAQLQTITATVSPVDPDGVGTLAYQWYAGTSSVKGTAVSGATGLSITLTQAQVGSYMRLQVDFTDSAGTAETLISAAVGPVTNVNDAPSGSPLIVGTAAQGQTLSLTTSAVTDADGLGTFSYTWLSCSTSTGTYTAISGATASTYKLTQAEVLKYVKARVSYVDGAGTAEAVFSAAIGPIANVNDLPQGSLVVTGAATQGQTLTVSATAITDLDGMP